LLSRAGRPEPADNAAMTESDPTPPIDPAGMEISLPSALELSRLGFGTLIDIRQAFELDLKGRIPDTVHIPLYEVKQMLGHPLNDDEQDILDAGKPAPVDAQAFFTTINRLHHVHDRILLLVCNSGRRTLYATQLLRSMGYPKTLSVAGGFQAWKKLQTEVKDADKAP
jgi:rhodanese-related sulfurtransferase